jgi:hypothetical protein
VVKALIEFADDDGVDPSGRYQRHMRHVVDDKLAVRFAFADAFGEDARRGAVRGRHAVADEKDDILRLARAGFVDRPCDLAGMLAIAGAQRIGAGLRERHIAQDESRPGLIVLARDEHRRPAEHFGVVVAVQGHRDLGRVGEAGEFDLEVKTGTRQHFRAVDRIDCLGRCGAAGDQ